MPASTSSAPGEGLLDNLLNFYDCPEGGNDY